MKEKVILIGGGGHCHSCIDVIEKQGAYEIAGIVENTGFTGQPFVMNYPVIGTDQDLAVLIGQYKNVIITVGQIRSAETRVRLFETAKQYGCLFPVIVSPTAYLSQHATVSSGTIIMHGAMINAGAVIGANCIINSRALVEHDTVIGNHTHISTGALINGNTSVGDNCFVGSGSVIRNGIQVGNNCVVGMGQSVLKDMPGNTQWIRKNT
jgi:sugar O-acyltransferase (sialic acid O-acetyltransferase NeuD family)